MVGDILLRLPGRTALSSTDRRGRATKLGSRNGKWALEVAAIVFIVVCYWIGAELASGLCTAHL